MPDLGGKSVSSGDFNLLWHGPDGSRTSMRTNEDGSQEFLIEQDLRPTLDWLAEHRNSSDGYSKSRELKKHFFIPNALRAHCINVEGWDPFDPKEVERLKRLMNDPDFANLRYSKGNVAVSNGVLR